MKNLYKILFFSFVFLSIFIDSNQYAYSNEPLSLVYGKLRSMKSFFSGDNRGVTDGTIPYYSWTTDSKNIMRLSDNSVILLTNTCLDTSSVNETYSLLQLLHLLVLKYELQPTTLSKYDSLGNKEWSVYIYEKHNNVISWDANDSLIVIYAQSYFYLDSTSREYNKDAVFISTYNLKGELLKRFELSKPDSIKKFIHPQQDDKKFNSGDWVRGISYQNALKIQNEQISLFAIGNYVDNQDTTYNSGLFFQKYNLNGELEYNKEIKHISFKSFDRYLYPDSNTFNWGIVKAYPLIRFLDDGNIFYHRSYVPIPDFGFFDTQCNTIKNPFEYNDFKFFLTTYKGEYSDTVKNKDHGLFLNHWVHKFDSKKNIYSILHCNPNDIFIKKYKNLIRKNPYNPDYNRRQPYLLKFDSTGKLLWLTQILSFPAYFSIAQIGDWNHVSNDTNQDYEKYYDDITSHYDVFLLQPNMQTPMNTGPDLIMAFDSVGNIFIPRFVDTCYQDEYLHAQVPSRKLVVIKLSPDGNVIWQDTSALVFNYDISKYSRFKYSAMRIKSAKIEGNSLYLDYFVSRLDGMTPSKDVNKFDLKEIYPIPDNDCAPKLLNQVLYDLLFLKFNINDGAWIGFKDKDLNPIDTLLIDTTCVAGTSGMNFKIKNPWKTTMNFEVPIVDGEGFSIVPSGTFSLSPNETKQFTVYFHPREFKTYNSKIKFNLSDIANVTNTLYLKGYTKSSQILTDSVWNLGTILINNTASKKFKVYNKGNVDSWYIGIKGLSPEFKQIQPVPDANFLKAGDSIEYEIEFTPTKVGDFTKKYKIISDIGCLDTFELTIRGRGVDESIELNNDSLNFGRHYSCESTIDTLIIENVTNKALTYQSCNLTGQDADNFTIIEKPADGSTLIRNQPLKFVIKYTPSGAYGKKSADLKIQTSEKELVCILTGEYSKIDLLCNNLDMGYRGINILYDSLLIIKNNTQDDFKLTKVLVNDTRIQIKSQLPINIVSNTQDTLYFKIQSQTTTPVNDKIGLSFEGRCTTTIDADITIKFDSSKVEINTIDFGTVPYCELRQMSLKINNTSKVAIQIKNIEFKNKDVNFEFSESETYPIQIDSNTIYSRNINFLPNTSKQSSTHNSKIVITLILNGKEEIYETEVKGSRSVPDIEYPSTIDIGEIKPGELKSIEYLITNNSSAITITEANISDNNHFTIDILPETIQSNTSGKVQISFTANTIGSYPSEMRLYYLYGSCKDSIIIGITGKVKRIMTIWSIHDTVNIGTLDYGHPIYASTDLGAKIGSSHYTLDLKYLPKIFNSTYSSEVEITNRYRLGDYEVIRINGTFPDFQDSTVLLFKLYGDILFSQTKQSPVELTFISSESSLSVDTKNGSISINSTCVDELRGIQGYEPASITINKQPLINGSIITVRSQNEGIHTLELYSISGERIELISWEQTSRTIQSRDIPLNKTQIPSGVYLLNLKTTWSNVTEVISIVE